MPHITILRSRPAMEGGPERGQSGLKNIKRVALNKCGERRWIKRDKRNEHVESRSAYRMSNETVRDRDSLILPDIR